MNKQSSTIIRMMNEDDLEAVLLIEQASFTNPWHIEHFQQEISAHHSFPVVAEIKGIIVGYLALFVLFEDAEILDIAVAPKMRGGGIARLLMNYAIKVAIEKDALNLSLEVRKSNIAAITLYETFGFVQNGIRAKYYDGVEDAVLMNKTLK